MNTTTTNTTPAPAKLTKMGKALLTLIGDWHGSFFDGGIEEGSGIYFAVLTDETAGAEGMAKTKSGQANVITKLGDDGYLAIDSTPAEDGEIWLSLTKLGAETALTLAGKRVQADEHAPAETTAPKLELVVDSTDKSKPAKGVFGKSVKEAVAEERTRRTAMQAADKALEAAGYSKQAQADKPVWGTAKMHGLKTGDLILFYGSDPKAPKASPTVRKYDAKKPELWGTPANRFWAAKGTPDEATPAKAAKAAPAKQTAPAKATPTPAAPVKQAAPSKPAPVMQDGIAFGTSGPACHALKVGDKFLYHGNDRKAGPVKTGHKLTLRITDRIWIEGVDAKGKVGMRVHIAKPFWAKKA